MAKFVENAAEEVLAAAKELLERGLVEGTSGNIIGGARQRGPIHPLPEKVDRDFAGVYDYLRTL